MPLLTVSKTSTTSIKEAEPMDKRLTRWTAAALLLGSLTFLGGCSPQNTTVNPDTKKETAAADAKAGQKGAQASSRTCTGWGRTGSSRPRP